MGQSKSKQEYDNLYKEASIDDIFKRYPMIKKYKTYALSPEMAFMNLKDKVAAKGLPSFEKIPGTNNYHCGYWDDNTYNPVFIGEPKSITAEGPFMAMVFWPVRPTYKNFGTECY